MSEPEFKAIDTKWMDDLARFDHWDLASNAEMAKSLAGMSALDGIGRIREFASLRLPQYTDLRNWATLHVLKAHAEGRAIHAMPAVRRAAQLAHSSGTLIGHMMAASLLNDEHNFVDVLKLKSWPTVPLEVIQAYRRISWAWVGLALENWHKGLPEEFKPYMKPQLGACTPAWETGYLGLMDFMEPRFPFETNFTSYFVRGRQMHREVVKMCGLEALKDVWEPTAGDIQVSKNSRLVRVPYLRRVLGLLLATAAVPDFFGIYDG
jgi:hypothetical protein